MAKDDLKPKTIAEIPFPGIDQTVSSGASSSKDDLIPTEIPSKTFPIANIATGLRSTSLDTETRTINSNYTFQKWGAISIGNLSYNTPITGTGIRISPNGIYGYSAGVTTFSLNAITGAFVTSGYIQVGGAAADVNGAVTLISPGKILISGSTVLSSWSAGGDATYIDGGKLYTGTVTADTVRSSWVYAGNIQADHIVSGTLTVGSGGAAAITIKHTASKSSAIVKWEGGSSIWEDSSNYLGIWSYGGEMYLWCGADSNARLILVTGSSQNSMYGGLHIYQVGGNGGNLNVDGDTHLLHQLLLDDDHITLGGGSPRDFSVRDMGLVSWHDGSGGRDRDVFTWGNGGEFSIDRSGSWFHVNGNDKSAIVKTSEGYRALYCAEAPEVWFFDFCESKEKIDPMFLEVTTGEMRFIRCDKGFQVWRRRKGHENKRFAPKTALEYYKNEKFLGLAK
jgi:hypothetical protein